MARSSRTNLIGNIMQKVGRALSSGSSSGRRSRGGGFGGKSRSSRRGKRSSSGASGLLRRLFG